MTPNASTSAFPFVAYFVPAVPAALFLFYSALQALARAPVYIPQGMLLAFCIFLTLSLLPVPFALRRLAHNMQAQAEYADPRKAEELLKLFSDASAEIGKAIRELDQSMSPIERPPIEAPEGRGRRLGQAFLLVFGFLGALALVSATFVQVPAAAAAHHDHAAFAVFANGERVDYSGMYFDLSLRQYLAAHLHSPNQDILHLEGRPGVTMEDIFRHSLEGRVTSTSLVLDEEVHGGLEFRSNETHLLTLWVSPAFSPAWIPVPEMASYVPQDGDRILVTFGNETAHALAAQMSGVSTTIPEA